MAAEKLNMKNVLDMKIISENIDGLLIRNV